MINVLINAYAVSPNWGSEPGMGWHWITNIAKYCNVHVITESEWEGEILEAVKKLPQKNNLHFHFNPVSPKVRKMCWNQGDWRFYWHYHKWQKRTLCIAKEIIATHKIDIIHQLNMIGFREPGLLWKIPDIPIVWGPIGGMVDVPASYLAGMSWKSKILFRTKNFISDFQARHLLSVRKIASRAYMFAAIKSVQRTIKNYYGKDIPIINETGTDLKDFPKKDFSDSSTFNMLWVGRLIPTKRLDIALRAVAACNNPKIRLTVCGVGNENDEAFYKNMIHQLDIENQINWLGKVKHEDVQILMQKSDLFFFTSIVEATSTVVVEAISVGLPILSFNTCGFGPLVHDFAGETIELTNPEQSIAEFANHINSLCSSPEKLKSYSEQEQKKRHILSWEDKGKQMASLYQNIIENSI